MRKQQRRCVIYLFNFFVRMLNKQRGFSLLLTVLLLSATLALGLGVSTFLIGEVRATRSIGNFVTALYAADSGIERTLYRKRQLNEFAACPTTSACIFSESLPNNASYNVIVLDAGVAWCNAGVATQCIRSIGTFSDATRALQAEF